MSNTKKARKPRKSLTQEDCIFVALEEVAAAGAALLRLPTRGRKQVGDPLLAALVYLRHAVELPPDHPSAPAALQRALGARVWRRLLGFQRSRGVRPQAALRRMVAGPA